MADCVFCKIVAGEIPCTKVFEDGLCLAFLDIGPISPGHTLLIPKAHYETIHQMPADEAAHLARHIPALARGRPRFPLARQAGGPGGSQATG